MTKLNKDNFNYFISLISIGMQNFKVIRPFFLEILLIQKTCNFIDSENVKIREQET